MSYGLWLLTKKWTVSYSVTYCRQKVLSQPRGNTSKLICPPIENLQQQRAQDLGQLLELWQEQEREQGREQEHRSEPQGQRQQEAREWQ